MDTIMTFRDYIKHLFAWCILAIIGLMLVVFSMLMLLHYCWFVVQANERCNQEICSVIEMEWNRYLDGVQGFAENGQLQRALSDAEERSAMNQRLYEFVFAGPLHADFVLLDENKQVITSSLYKVNQELLLMNRGLREDLQALDESPDVVQKGVMHIPFLHGQEASYVFLRAVRQDGRTRGYLIFSLKEESFNALLHDKDMDNIAVMDAFDHVIFSTNRLLVDSLGKFNEELEQDGIVRMRDRPYYAEAHILADSHIRVVTMTSLVRQKQLLQFGGAFLLFISLVLLMCMPFFVDKVTARSLRSIDGLMQAVRACSQGDIAYQLRKQQSFQEFQILYENFNSMMRTLQQLLKSNSEMSERKRLMEVKQLEGQFNPHFAFNVMEVLRYEIFIDPQKASEMVVAFANLMRYTINYGSSYVTLQTDICYVQDYLRLQKMRYGQRLQYEIDIASELLSCRVPKLLVQPIVENSIVHGLEETKCIKIVLRGWRESKELLLCVEDNGPGLSKEKYQELTKLLTAEEADPAHIGIYNVHRALRLLYGDAYGLTLYNMPAVGLRVVLKLPLRWEDEQHV